MHHSCAPSRLLKVCLGVLLCLLAGSLPGCREDDEMGQLLDDPGLNNGKNFPDSWQYWQNDSNHKFFWSPKTDNPKDFYFALEATAFDMVNYSFLSQTVTTPIPKGKQLVLRAKVKAEQLTGAGANLVVRCEGLQGVLVVASARPQISIAGHFDWKEFSIVLDKVPDETNTIQVLLSYLPATTGKVYFDDITLTYQK